MQPLSIEELAVRSRAVVRATVRQHQSAWDTKQRRIYTLTEVTVTEVLAGEAPDTLLIRTMGGVVDGVGMKVNGTPRLVAEQDVVLFLRDDPMGRQGLRVVGLSQGLYRLEKDAAGRLLAVSGVEGVAFLRPGEGAVRPVTPATDKLRVPLTTLRDRVRTAHAAGAPATPVRPGTTSPAQQPQPVTR